MDLSTAAPTGEDMVVWLCVMKRSIFFFRISQLSRERFEYLFHWKKEHA